MLTTLWKSALAAATIMFSTSLAFAHAELMTATPATGSTIATAPTEIILTFSEEIDLKFSGAKLEDAMKMDFSTGAASLAKDNNKTLVVPITTPLAAGDYVVAWHNLSKDGHKIKGSFKFTVKP